MATLTKAQQIRLKEINDDPVLWAQTFLRTYDARLGKETRWTARWYQVEMLRDRTTRRVYRCGRRTGKCLPGDSTILDYRTGERITVKELFERQQAYLITMDEKYKLQKHFTNQIFENGIKEVFEVETSSGRTIRATGNHPLFTATGWAEIDDLKVGDKVAIASKMPYFGNQDVEDEKIKMVAYMIGDGNCTTSTIRFSTASNKIKEDVEESLEFFNCSLIKYNSSKKYDYNIVKKENRNNRFFKNNFLEYLKEIDLLGKDSFNKRIPDFVFKMSKEKIALFLSRLYSTDGWATTYKNRLQIGYSSVSINLIKDVQHLLLRFGINSYITSKKINGMGDKKYYSLYITNSLEAIKFIEEINIYSKEDATKKVYELAKKNKKSDSLIPKEILTFVEEERVRQGLTKRALCEDKDERFRLCYDIKREKLKHYGEVLGNEDIINFSDGDFLFEKIVSIKSVGMMQTYDFTVPITSNFVVDDFITHNTEVMVVDSLYHALTHQNFRVLIVTPYENQVRLAFTRLNELINASPLIKARITSSTKNPYKIDFDNNSGIWGFTTGASTGSGAASIRGQRADLIVMDEVDYMSEADFDSVMMIAGERSDIKIVMSSTPTGKRSKFYQACTDPNMHFTEHYHPSMHNPNWNSEMEAEFRATLSDQGYVHEVEAEFGTQDTGVFDKVKLDKAMQIYDYAYNQLNYYQENNVRLRKETEPEYEGPDILMYSLRNKAPYNPFRTMGVEVCPTAR